MKKLFVVLMACISLACLLAGCETLQEEIPPEVEIWNCSECSKDTADFIPMCDGGKICGTCFRENHCQICLKCGLAYIPTSDSPDGICYSCKEHNCCPCSFCEEVFALNHLVDVGGGYYLCPVCAGQYLLEADPDIGDVIAELSPIGSRNETN